MTDEPNYDPVPPLPLPEYPPLIANLAPSHKKNGQVVAFLGKQLCFFESGEQQPSLDTGKVEVMITRPLWTKLEDGGWNFKKVLALLIRPVGPEWTLIQHNGFECSGSMCSTTAYMIKKDGGYGPWLTPGRTQIFEAGNVNAGRTWKVPYTAKRPGRAYVSTFDLASGKFPLRIEGLARIEDGMFANAVRK